MPETNQTSSKAVERICKVLKSETIDPAKKEANEILNQAKMRAEEIIETAEKQAKEIINDSEQKVIDQRKIFVDEIKHIAKETIRKLHDEVLQLFSKDFKQRIADSANNPNYIAKAIESILDALKKEGINANMEAYVSKHVAVESVAKELAVDVVKQLDDGKLLKVGDHAGGCSILIKDEQLSISLTEVQLNDILKDQVQHELETLLFG